MDARSWIAATAVATAALSGALASRGADAAPPAQPVSTLGAELWLGDCAVCHGEDGRGTARGPDLTGVGAAGVYLQVATGRMPLPSPDEEAAPGPVTYGPVELDALVAYAGRIIPGPPVPDVDLAGADLARGGEEFRRHCAACHQMAGQGGILPDGHDVPPLTSSEPVEVVAAMRGGPGDMPQFPAEILDAEAADDVAAYVRELRDARDRGGWPLGHWGPVPEGAAALALALIPLVAVVRWLGDRNPPAEQEDDIR